MGEQIMFYILSAVILIFSFLTVSSRSILRAATYLLFVLIATAGYYFIINYNFLAAVQLTVYAGGIVVLIVFSVLLTHRINNKMEQPSALRQWASLGLTALAAAVTIKVILDYDFASRMPGNIVENSSVRDIGKALLNYGEGGFVLPFEVISVLLLAAMIGAIVIAKRRKMPETDNN